MAKRRPNHAMAAAAQALADAVEQQQEESQPDPLSPSDDPEVIESVLEGLRRLDQGGGNRITWYVYNDSIDDAGYIEKLRTDQLDEDLFKTRYGPGEYRVRGRDSSGQYVKGSSSTVKISGVISEPRRRTPTSATVAENDPLAFMREMQAANDRRAQQRAEENKHWAQALAVPFATVAAAFISRPRNDLAALVTAIRPQQSSLSEMTQALVSLQSLQGERSNSVDVLLKVLDRVKDMPDSPGEGGWLGLVRDVIREAAPHAKELITRMGTTAPPPVPGMLPASATAGPPFGPGIRITAPTAALPNGPVGGVNGTQPAGQRPASESNAPPTTNPTTAGAGDMWSIAEPWLRRRAEELHEDAAANMDVELVAEALLERARKRFGMFVSLEQLAQLLQHPQWWEFLTSFYPPLTPYQAWVNDVRNQLLLMVTEDMGARPQSPTPEETRQ